MLKKKENKKDNDNTVMKLLVIILIFFLLIVAIISMKKFRGINNKILPNKENMAELFNNIKDNYTLEIEKKINDNTKNIVYSRDKNLILFEGDYEAKGYLVYKSKVYELNSNNKIIKSKLSLNKIEDSYYDIDLIKKLFNYCDVEYVNNVKALCKIKYSDYLNEYNTKYKTKIEIDVDNSIEFYIVHYSDRIGKIIVDYSGINKIINNTEDSVNYGILIKDIDNNDFSDYLNYYKKELSK